MDGRGRALDNVFVERLWRTVKYEEVYVKDDGPPREAIQGLEQFVQFYHRQRPHQA
jgi:putative transposase